MGRAWQLPFERDAHTDRDGHAHELVAPGPARSLPAVPSRQGVASWISYTAVKSTAMSKILAAA